jgi:hypothetical protein
VRGSRKTVAAAALLLAFAAGGCGGSGGSGSSASTAQAPLRPSQPKADLGQPRQDEARRSGQSHSGGGGAAEFRVPGGDNSIQEFGAEAGRSELKRAAAALHGFLDARAGGEWSKACTYLTKSAVASFEQLAARSKQGREGCGAVMEALSGGVPKSSLEEAAQADVGALRTGGGRAFLLYHGARATDYAISMAKEGGAWKVGALAGTPLS